MDLLIATNNRSKFHEMNRILVAVPAVLRSLADLEIRYEVAETGTTFGENASLKASTYARIAKMPTLADDSGLVIDYLYGEPGVRSARFAGASSTDDQRIAKVLSQMSDAKKDERSASFVCVTTFADETGKILCTTEGVCKGRIAEIPRGHLGFGYDPIFAPDGFDRTFGELGPEVKDQIGHRGQAIAKIIPFLRGFFDI